MYKTTKLKFIASILTGFPFDGNLYSAEGIKVLRGENITIGELRWDSIKCWNYETLEFKKYFLKHGDVVIGMDGSRVGKNRAKIKNKDLPLLLAQRVACLRSNELSNQDFLYYLIRDNRFEKYVAKVQTGSSIPHISLKQIEEFSISLPPLYEQKAIANILSALDAKIELNQRINAELEAMAKTIYDYWFVQFDFPDEHGEPYKSSGGKMVWSEALKREIPAGWEVKKIIELADTASGGTPLSTKKEYYENGTIPWVNSGELNNPFIIKTSSFITEAGLNNSSTKMFPTGTTLIALYGATAGKVSSLQIDACTNQAVCAILSKSSLHTHLLRYGLNNLYAHLVSLSSGSARDNLSQDIIRNIKFATPNNTKILTQFNKFISKTIELSVLNLVESQTLTELRDWLLPMLMNGQVTVKTQDDISNPNTA